MAITHEVHHSQSGTSPDEGIHPRSVPVESASSTMQPRLFDHFALGNYRVVMRRIRHLGLTIRRRTRLRRRFSSPIN